jgi:hypothetical protein
MPIFKNYSVFLFALAFWCFSACQSPSLQKEIEENEKIRTVILTDMTHDDGNSLIRYLYYSSLFDLEALIITNQLPDFNYDDPDPWNKGMGILEAYRMSCPNCANMILNCPLMKICWQ